jgi:hypothetical protein
VVLTWKTKSSAGGATEVLLAGDVAEDARFDDLHLRGDRAIFDFAKVKHFNSEGLRRLVHFLRAEAERRTLEAKRCSPAVVNQLNLIPELVRLLEVRSVFVPLECPRCGEEAEVLVDLPADRHRPATPDRPCNACGARMEMAEPVTRYFAFLEDGQA